METNTRAIKCFGYYIVKALPSPEWCTLKADNILLAGDNGLSEKFPDLEKCFWANYPETYRVQYQKYLRLTDAEFAELRGLIAELFANDLISGGARFARFEDVKRIYKYLKNVNGYKIIGLFTDLKTYAVYEEDGFFKNIMTAKECTAQKDKIGCEILGGESLGSNSFFFDSYIINSLNKVLEARFGEKYMVDIQNGLVQNSFEETQSFCDLLQGQGEPVEWTAFEVYEFAV